MKTDRWIPLVLITLLFLQVGVSGLVALRLRSLEERVTLLQMSVSESMVAGRSDGQGAALPEVEVETGDAPAKGPSDAPVTIVEFSDFTCSACLQLQPRLARVLREHSDSVRLVYRYFPLAGDGEPMVSALAAECGRRQGRFWEMHDALFEATEDEETLGTVADVEPVARELGLDLDAFRACMTSDETPTTIWADREAGRSYGVQGTPTLFVNGRRVRGAVSEGYLSFLVEELASRGEQGATQPTPAS